MTMPDAWPDLAGRLDGNRHILPVRIYFEDTDFSGFVYHGSYVRFMERGRTDFLRKLGVGHDELDKGEHGGEGLVFVVRRMALEFKKPARIDDIVEIETRPKEIGGVRIILVQTIRRGDEVLVTAEVTVVLVTTGGELRRLPEGVRTIFGLDPT